MVTAINREDIEKVIGRLGLEKSHNLLEWGVTTEMEAHSYSHFQEWTKKGLQGPLKYLEGERGEKRKSVQEVFPWAQGAIVFLFSTAHARKAMDHMESKGEGKWGSYAWAFPDSDYHQELKKALENIGQELAEKYLGLQYSTPVDTHPILERDLAYRCGLGWFGKNSLMISRKHGSHFLIGSLILDRQIIDNNVRELESDHCGHCTACITACPTNAIDLEEMRTINAEKCLSTFTIELFNPPSSNEFWPSGHEEIFGCDICQTACPWNQAPLREATGEGALEKILSSKAGEFFLGKELSEIENELAAMSNKGFFKQFKNTPMGRTGRKGILKNIKALKMAKNKQNC